MSNHDALGPYEHVSDQEANNALAVREGGVLGGVVQTLEEAFEVLRKLEIGLLILRLGFRASSCARRPVAFLRSSGERRRSSSSSISSSW